MEIISMDIRTFDALMARVKTIEEKADMLCKRQEDLGLKKWLEPGGMRHSRHIEAYPTGVPGQRITAFRQDQEQAVLQAGRCGESITIVLSCKFKETMSHYFIDKQDPRVADLLLRLENTGRALKKMEPNCQRSFNGERFMNDVELAKFLRISRRTLQEYRSLRILPYYLIQGKVLYKESEIQQLLEEAHRKCLDEQRKWL